MKGSIIKQCPICKNEFSSFVSDKRKYCSMKCYHKSPTRGTRPRNRVTKNCTYCGEQFERPSSNFKKNMNPFCNQRCMGKYFEENGINKGENNIRWRGGYSQSAYRTGWNRLKKETKERANNVCEICNDTHKFMDVHHKIPVCSGEDIAIINDIKNLQYLCRPCHIKADAELRGRYPNGK